LVKACCKERMNKAYKVYQELKESSKGQGAYNYKEEKSNLQWAYI